MLGFRLQLLMFNGVTLLAVARQIKVVELMQTTQSVNAALHVQQAQMVNVQQW